MLNRLTDALNFHGDALALRSQRQQLLASNIANVDTPNYQARELDFKTALRDATAQPGAGAAGRGAMLATSSRGHITAGPALASTAGLAGDRFLYARPAQTNLDGNTVDMDRERASFADNAVKYEASLRFINGNVRTMLDAIKGQS
ncbi:flagellar basal body rod protein FlgB [Piscinibacter sakaiensis]|uniref:flagellar basal body rod protein FlgB n=1 Tax=Piscinibacter sakaiensis TaxID=1547922 RepID=UPI003AAAFDB9